MLTLLLAVSKTQAVPTQFSTARTAFNRFLSGTLCLGVIRLLQKLIHIYKHCDSVVSHQSVLEEYLQSEILSFIHL